VSEPDLPDPVDDDSCARPERPASAAETVLAFEQVTFGYNRLPVLREVSLHVREREFVALVGGNGAGKTTMMRLGLGLLRPTHGTVRLFGERVERFRRRCLVGYVPQRAAANLAIPISVGEVVRTGLAGHLGLVRRPNAKERQRVEHVLDLLGLSRLRRQPIAELSGGQLQRTLIARALVTQPQLLVLDEPTTGVDADARRILREALEHLVETEGVAVVYISHDPEGFQGLADRVVEVHAGRLRALPVTGPTTSDARERLQGPVWKR
jgi:zinc transport system ATP-binding protein